MSVAAPPSREDIVKRKGYTTPFESHTVFLTGSTGSLGGCLLYKLILQLPTRKIFILIRGSPETAIKKWERGMPDQTQAILNSKKVHFLVGDITKPDFGMGAGDIQKLREEVTLVIHTAATIVLNASIRESIENNCLPSLELARLASQFRRLKLFVQLSTAYANSFLPDGHVGEKLYAISDQNPDDELDSVMSSGISPHAPRFSSPYAYAKHLMERLLLKRYPLLPLLLVRPTIFGAALRHPYPVYGPENSTPLTKFAKLYLGDQGGTQVWHAAEGYKTGANILDEIPVDFVANACLLHAAAKTQGIVQIGSQLYVPFTFDEFLHIFESNAPPAAKKELPEIIFTEDHSAPQTLLAELVKVGTRNWQFDCGRSYWLKQMAGPLSLSASKHEAEALNAARIPDIYRRSAIKAAKL
ncbi:hypothetical protein ASPWEDRAFT_166152 [Aspergillus wentii DTO 134E9]|uniref:Fatty acyl-CoA reductase n=1 Tax=Aspergillus wentii DTO 134E9 TaxID=1073089 RepID=A0A1L9RYL9_ASPWE|nr:uncharacterized protein ASPWEDRAFT_166152 [Aspergillus wentii DTO 134E9]KAI9932499.1 hypothetical protein MW887_008740 [Aspergillus wentii]OJJ40066.1 hypothetical protein ASPWEDRAFT_166152 [Aspergillus wentii DTO 134E9]